MNLQAAPACSRPDVMLPTLLGNDASRHGDADVSVRLPRLCISILLAMGRAVSAPGRRRTRAPLNGDTRFPRFTITLAAGTLPAVVADTVSLRARPPSLDPAGEYGHRDARSAASTAVAGERELVDELLGRLQTAQRSANVDRSSVRSIWYALVNGDDRDP